MHFILLIVVNNDREQKERKTKRRKGLGECSGGKNSESSTIRGSEVVNELISVVVIW